MPIRVGTQPILKFYAGPDSGPTDPDAITYINAVIAAGGSLSNPEKAAIDTFFISLKSASIYSTLYAMYPFFGGVANAHKINAVNPGTYDLTFNGTWTHSNANGSATTDVAGNYADTGFNPSLFSVTTNFSFGNMVVNAGLSNGYSGIGNSASTYLLLGQAGAPSPWYLEAWNGASSGLSTSPAASYTAGALQINSRTGASAWTRNYVPALSAGTITTNSFTNTISSYSANIYLNDINGASGNNMSGDYRFAYMGQGLNGTQIQDFADAINTLNTAFSRNLW